MKKILLAICLSTTVCASQAHAQAAQSKATYYAEVAYSQVNNNNQANDKKNMEYFAEVESYQPDGSGYVERFVANTGSADITNAINAANAMTASCNAVGTIQCVQGNPNWTVELLTIRYQR